MVDDLDKRLFRDSIGQVRRHRNDRIPPRKKRASPRLRPAEPDPDLCIKDELSDGYEPNLIYAGDRLEFKRNGLQERILRRLRKGYYPAEEVLDLHGMTIPIAREALIEFLVFAQIRGLRCVLIIHGKGRSSPNSHPVLKTKIANWLTQLNQVLAFVSAQPRDGGTGAAYVLLRATRS